MPGTIIITGGNDSLAVPATQLLAKYPEHTIILTQRNPQTINQPTSNSRVYVKKLDLEDFSAVHAFANAVATDVQVGKIPPLTSIICNAYHWNLRTAPELTGDGYEKTFQVHHIAHAALVLRLLGHFDSVSGCCIVLFSSDAHWTGKNSLEKYPPVIREANGLDALRYASSKLATVMWMYSLKRRLEADHSLGKITAVAVNPGNPADSRALRVNTPPLPTILSMLVIIVK
ncbi:hypothetical protein BDW72DRAFT_204652 [Aspergillus terricola var. indicus]